MDFSQISLKIERAAILRSMDTETSIFQLILLSNNKFNVLTFFVFQKNIAKKCNFYMTVISY